MVPTRMLGLLGCLMLLPSLRGQDVASCAQGWWSLPGGCYGFFPRPLSWRGAETFCRSLGAHLASVPGAGERGALAAMLATSRSEEDSSHDEDDDDDDDDDEGDEDVWIGLHQPLGAGGWRWADGSALDNGSWHRWPGRGDRACAALRHANDFLRWRSDVCARRKPFVCKSSA